MLSVATTNKIIIVTIIIYMLHLHVINKLKGYSMRKLILIALSSLVIAGCSKQPSSTATCQSMFDTYDKYADTIKSQGASERTMDDIKKQRSYFENTLLNLTEENKIEFCKKVTATFNQTK